VAIRHYGAGSERFLLTEPGGGERVTRYVSHLRRDLPAHAFVSQLFVWRFRAHARGADGNHNTGCPRYPRARSIA